LILEKVPLLLLAAASAAVAFLSQRSGGTVISLASVPISARIARAAVLYVAYLGRTLWPVNLAVLYSEAPMESAWPAVAAGALLALLTAGALWGAWRGQRWLAVGWFWYLATLLPTIGLVQVGMQVMADRFLYLPQIGMCVAAAWGAAHLAGSRRYRRWPLAVVAALAVAASIACAWQQTRYWRDSETLWVHTLACTPSSPLARKVVDLIVEGHNKLGVLSAGRGQVREAIVHFRKALEIRPEDARAHYNLGVVLAGQGKLEEANEQLTTALGLATAQNDQALAKDIRTQIHRCQPVAPADNTK
jgi:tetratricopeptide (TPR) repeat protein